MFFYDAVYFLVDAHRTCVQPISLSPWRIGRVWSTGKQFIELITVDKARSIFFENRSTELRLGRGRTTQMRAYREIPTITPLLLRACGAQERAREIRPEEGGKNRGKVFAPIHSASVLQRSSRKLDSFDLLVGCRLANRCVFGRHLHNSDFSY